MEFIRKAPPRPKVSHLAAGIEKARTARQAKEPVLPLPPPIDNNQYDLAEEDIEMQQQHQPVVHVFDGNNTTPPHVRLCMLALALIIVTLITVVVIFIVSNQHKSHSLKPGQFSNNPVLLSNNIFVLNEDGQEKQKSLLVVWPFRLPDQIQEQILLPQDDYIPNLSLDSASPLKVTACCYSAKKNIWFCNGEHFDANLFVDPTNQRPKLSIFINSYFLAGSQCNLEVELLT